MADLANAPERIPPRTFHVINAVVSFSALLLLGYVLRLRPTDGGVAAMDLRFMPAVNASLLSLIHI